MDKKEIKTEDPVFLELVKALKKQLALQNGSQFSIQLDLGKTGEDWKLLNSRPVSSQAMAEGDEAEVKKELKATKKRLRSVEQQIIRQEKMASLGLLTAGIAHEIKNPLNFVTNFSDLSLEYLEEMEELLQEKNDLQKIREAFKYVEDIRTNLKKIRNHGQRAEGIVRSMLMHSRGDNENYEPIDLNSLLREYVNLAFHGMRANKNPINVEIKLDLDPNLGMVKLNAESFSRVILNLCKNAFDAMREKAATAIDRDYRPQLMVSTRLEREKAVVIFEDNGPGIPEELKKKILTPFFTTKKGAEGTGLGLSISKEIIQEHQATLKVESRVGDFTRFKIELQKNKRNGDESTNSG